MPNPPKRLVVLFDGTDNTPKDRTNVWRTHELLAEADEAGTPQLRNYIQGVGTEIGSLAAGSIFGVGVARKIREGYRWLVEHYEDGDEVYVFGFSRGAFKARSLVQMIATCGLTRPHALGEWSVESTFARYEVISKQDTEIVRPIWRLRHWMDHAEKKPAGWSPTRDDARLCDDSKVHLAKIRMAGLWDTVGALGSDALKNQAATTQKAAAHNVRPTKAQEHGYHAVAIDEHRPMFDVTLWRRFVPTGDPVEDDYYTRHYEQRWFIGAHSDVGGGYGDDSLPDISLAWMLEKAQACGLAFTHTLQPEARAWYDTVHDSFKGFAGGLLSLWDKVLEGDQRLFRAIAKPPRPVATASGTQGALHTIRETLDDSVLRRWSEDPTYRPPSLVEYFRRNLTQLPPNTRLAHRTSRIYAANYWNETGVHLKPNTKYRATVVPQLGEPLRDGSHTAKSIVGEPWTSRAHRVAALAHGKRFDAANWFALIASIDRNRPWLLVDGAEFVTPISGQLLCFFNDVAIPWFYENNSGWVALEVEEL